MKPTRNFRAPRAVLVCLLLCALCLSQGAMAAGLDTAQTGSLTIQNNTDSGSPLAGAAFRIYQVAAYQENTANFTLTKTFQKYADTVTGLDRLNNLDSAGWQTLASTLAAQVAADQVKTDHRGTTDSKGTLTISGLPTGLYLVAGDPLKVGNDTYTPAPLLVSVPVRDEEAWEYQVTVNPKQEKTHHDPGGNSGTTKRKVVKVWQDDGDKGGKRPAEIVVALLKNGQVHATVTLNAGNGWTHTWTGLSDRHQWQVVEQSVPEGYTVSVTQSGQTFLVTNTDPGTPVDPDDPDDPPPGPDDPDDPDDPDNPSPGPDDPDNPTDKPDKPNKPNKPSKPSKPTLPQTGQLNWPIPLLAAAGLGLFAGGWYLWFGKKDDHEA